MNEKRPHHDLLAETSGEAIGYRCVCGELVTTSESRCEACGRHYDSAVLNEANAATTEFDPSLSVQSTVRPGSGEEPEDDYVDKRLGHFRMLESIGHGGMGAVYRALDESLERYVAIKVLRASPSGSRDSHLQKLFQEARAQARVNHPNVAHIYYVGREGDTPYLAMELVGSETLADRLRAGPMAFNDVARYGFQIAAALNAASGFGIVHGDIKPANVLMVDDSTVKLSDFGLALRVTDIDEDSSATAGTPNYMPPEAADGPIDHRGDMYSLGVALFEMTFGRLPYESSRSGSDVQHVMSLHRDASVEFPEPWPDELPEGWREILTRLLAKDPDARYRSFRDLGAALKAVQPISRPSASLLLRAPAWLADMFVIVMPLILINAFASMIPFISSFSIVPIVASAALLVAVGGVQVVWGTTPGKLLFQIRIVDQHGLRPARHVLGGRSVFQYLLAWAASVADPLLSMLTFDFVAGVFSLIALVILAAEALMIVLGGGRSLHDKIFRTRVVLDA